MHGDNFPVHLELVKGRLSAWVYSHPIKTGREDMPVVDCWSYVSDGLSQHGQKEMVFTLRREAHEDPNNIPDEPLNFLIFIEQLASQGQTVEAGGLTRFGPGGALFDRHLVYIPTLPMGEVPLPPGENAITALLVTEEELTAGEQLGISRLISRLGYAGRYYPCPPWSERDRAGLSFKRDLAESVLIRSTRFPAPGVRAVMEANRLRIRLPSAQRRSPASAWQRRVWNDASNTPLALLIDIEPDADGCLVWDPEHPGPTAITPPGSRGERLSGCFLLFTPGQAEDEVHLIEDGYALMLTNHTWGQLRFFMGEDAPLMFQGATITLHTRGEREEVAISRA
jgi:hypothetical protein